MVVGRVKFLIVLFYFIFLSGQIIAQETEGEKTLISLDKYDVIQYISTIGAAPENIINLDNNGDILLACISGKTTDQLKSMGIHFTASQIRLLKDWRLLKEENKIFKTTFPILNADKTKSLRDHSKKISSYLGHNLQDDIIHLKKELKLILREKNIYSILFSYIIDGLVWDRFIDKGILKERKITVEEPFWSGVIWAVYPPRDFSCGTNSISDQGVSLYVNWSEKTIKQMIPFVADWKNLRKMFNDFLQKGKVEDENAKKVFSPFNLFSSSGQFTIPIIEEKKGDTLYEICFLISKKIAKEVPKLLDLSQLKEEFDFLNEEQTLVIVYHEVMWDLLDYFEKQNLIQKPIAFANPEKAESKDIADLVFFVKRSESR